MKRQAGGKGPAAGADRAKRLKNLDGKAVEVHHRSVWQDPEHPILENVFQQLLAMEHGPRLVSARFGVCDCTRHVVAGFSYHTAAPGSLCLMHPFASNFDGAAPGCEPRLLLLACGRAGDPPGRHRPLQAPAARVSPGRQPQWQHASQHAVRPLQLLAAL